MTDKDYNEYALLWSVFSYMTNTLVNVDETTVAGFVREFGLNTKAAKFVANEEGIDTKNYI